MVESVHVVETLEKRECEQMSGVEIELVNKFLDLMSVVFSQGNDDGVLNDVIVECVLDDLLSRFVVINVGEDLASLVFPTTELLC
jgi:hypothetical protein